MKLQLLAVFIALVLVMSGCVNSPEHARRLQVNFPQVKLDKGEYIQDVEVKINFGVVACINRPIEDWNYSVTWDNPDQQIVSLNAGHFSSGLDDIRQLDGFITIAVQPNDKNLLRVETVLTTENTDPAGGGMRKIRIEPKQMLLKRVTRR